MPYGSSLPEFQTSGITFNSRSTLPSYRGRDIGVEKIHRREWAMPDGSHLGLRTLPPGTHETHVARVTHGDQQP